MDIEDRPVEGIDDDGLVEHAFTCPYCWETVTMLVDTSVTDQDYTQDYVEDCEVCCNPIGIFVRTTS